MCDPVRHTLQTAEGQAVYKRRKAIVEPAFGRINEGLGGQIVRPKRRRRSGRVNLPAVLQGSVDVRYDVTVINLSASGAMIEHSERLSPGQTCSLFVLLPGVDLRLRAQLVWSQVNQIHRVPQGKGNIRFRSGLHFPNLAEGEAAHLRQYLATLSAQGTDPTQVPDLAPDAQADTSPAVPEPEEQAGLPDSAFFDRFR